MTYTNVNAQQITNLLNELKSQGATVMPGSATNSWQIDGKGIEAQASYDPSSQILTVQVLVKPFFIEDSLIDSQIKKALGQA